MGRNLYEPEQMLELGITYDCIGRPGEHATAAAMKGGAVGLALKSLSRSF